MEFFRAYYTYLGHFLKFCYINSALNRIFLKYLNPRLSYNSF